MAEGGEMKGFVFSLIFIIVFSTLLSSIPVGLQGTGTDPDTVIPIDPSLVTGFAETNNWTRAVYTAYSYEYDAFGGRDWLTTHDDIEITIFAKVKVLGFLWLGALNPCKFISPDDIDREGALSFAEIDADADEGAVRYDLKFYSSGDSAGKLVVYWNTTTYSDSEDAWTNNGLNLLHGMGIDDTATANIGSLIVSLLTLQLPDVPVLINMFLAVPIWACIVYVLWFLIKEMIPFV